MTLSTEAPPAGPTLDAPHVEDGAASRRQGRRVTPTGAVHTVLLVEDHPLLRSGLRQLIGQLPGFTLVGEAGDGAAAAALWLGKRPSVVVLDLQLPDCHGIDLLRSMRPHTPECRVLIVSSDPSAVHVQAAIEAGVLGYFLKTEPLEELEKALHDVAEGRIYLSPHVMPLALGRLEETTGIPFFTVLSPRELDMVRMLASGLRTKEIAAHMGVSVKTAETFRRRVNTKLGISSIADLTRYAIRQGLVKA